MERIQGLKEYIARKEFKEALRIPEETEISCGLLAQGEYNINYVFTHPITQKKLVLRINAGSQMHLEDQIGYEYQALKGLEHSGRTPIPYYVDGTRKYLPYGIMVMEFLEGVPLDYRKDMPLAAECLADIHSTPVPEQSILLHPESPLHAILDECDQMFRTYEESELGDEQKKCQIRHMLEAGRRKADRAAAMVYPKCCINTELNSGNFLINGKGKNNYLIDWEKPLLGDPAQDLGHFLAPTTTFWKTDVILTEEEIRSFVELYEKAVNGRIPLEGLKERVDIFIPITCLRGITWCAMAWVEYQQPDKLIQNAFTKKKLDDYLSPAFLNQIEQRYYAESVQ